jgi:hypothetical protein
MNSDLSNTCRERITPYNHSTGLDTNLHLGVRVCSIGAVIGGSDCGIPTLTKDG